MLRNHNDQIALKHSWTKEGPTKNIIIVTSLSFGLIIIMAKIPVNFSPVAQVPEIPFYTSVCIYERTRKLRVYANRDEVQRFLNMDFNRTLEKCLI